MRAFQKSAQGTRAPTAAPAPTMLQSGAIAIQRAVTIASLAAGLLFIASAPASAHTALISSDPPANTTLFTSPAAVTLTFNEDIAPTLVTVVVDDAAQINWILAERKTDARAVRALLKSATPAGTYTVKYRVVSADGHPVSGTFTFSIAPPAASAPKQAASTADATPIAADTTSTPSSDVPYLEWMVGGAAGIALLIVGARLKVIDRREDN